MKLFILLFTLSTPAFAITKAEVNRMGLNGPYKQRMQEAEDVKRFTPPPEESAYDKCRNEQSARGGECTLCPDGTYVNHPDCKLGVDGKYY